MRFAVREPPRTVTGGVVKCPPLELSVRRFVMSRQRFCTTAICKPTRTMSFLTGRADDQAARTRHSAMRDSRVDS